MKLVYNWLLEQIWRTKYKNILYKYRENIASKKLLDQWDNSQKKMIHARR